MVVSVQERIKDVFNKQTTHQWVVRNTTAEHRKEKLKKLKEELLSRKDQIVEASIKDYVKPVSLVENEIFSIVSAIDYILENLSAWMQVERVEDPQDGEAYIVYESRGRVCIFGTWNSPLSVTIHPMIEALAAGNCVIIKPSEFNPAFNAVLKELIESVFEEQEVAVVEGEVDIAEALMKLPFDHFFFTGSPRVGKIGMREAANHLAAVTLELGGKSPVVLQQGYNMFQAAQTLVFGKVLISGQFCICPDYIWAHEEDIPLLAEAYRQLTMGMLYDNGQLRSEERTQIVNEQHYNRIKGLYEDAIAKGAIVLSGGTFDDTRRLIEPTLLTNVTEDMLIAEEEVFGPITFVKGYSTIDQALSYIQQRPKPLALYIYSNDEAFQLHVLQNTSSGGVTINGICMHNTYLQLPFGGVNNSGFGSFHGIHGFKTFSHQRAVYHIIQK